MNNWSNWPKNDADTLYVHRGISMDGLIEQCKDHFGEDIDMSMLNIEAEYVNFRNIYYDLYDPGDYASFLCITRMKGKS